MIISQRPPLLSLLRIFAIVVFVGWLVIGQTIGVIVGALIYDGNFLIDYGDPANHPQLKNAMLVAQGVGAAVGLIFIPWFYVKVLEQRNFNNFFKNETNWPTVITLILIAVIGVGISLSPVVEWNAAIEFPQWMGGFARWAKETEALAANLIKLLTTDMTAGSFIFIFIVIAVIPGIGEEIVFRGLIQTEFQRLFKNPHAAIWTSAILFSAIHLQFLGFFPRMFLGAFLGYTYYWSGNLLIPIIGHFLNNGLQLVGLYLHEKGVISFDVENPESAPLTIVAMAAIITILVLYYLKKYFYSRTTTISDVN